MLATRLAELRLAEAASREHQRNEQVAEDGLFEAIKSPRSEDKALGTEANDRDV